MDRLERSEARIEPSPRLERIAWNAAALAALAVMILVLLGTLEWLDQVAPAPRGAEPVAAVSTRGPAGAADRRFIARRRGRGASATAPAAARGLDRADGACIAPAPAARG